MIFTKIVIEMKDIYTRLKTLGISRAFARKFILPDWWEDSMESVPANRSLAEIILSRQLGLDLATLRDPEGKLHLRPELSVRFKKREGVEEGQLDVAQALASRLATLAALCVDKPFRQSHLTARHIRQMILEKGSPWVGMDALLDFCWDLGIPVIQLCQVPIGSKKMDGMACWQEGHPVIVIPCQRQYMGWHAFILAHELGHVMCGHISPDSGYVLDDKVDRSQQQLQEIEANAFATELLMGHRDMMVAPASSYLTGVELARTAQSLGEKMQMDPGVIILNYSWNQKFFPVAMTALKELSQQSDAASRYQARYDHLDLEMLPEDSQRVFESLTASRI